MNLLIVLHHTGPAWLFPYAGTIEKNVLSVQTGITWTLPSLFCLSGYLMMKGFSFATVKNKFLNRLKRLAAPLFFVNWLIIPIVGVGILLGFVHDPKYNLEWVIRSVFCFKEGTTLSTLWYVRTLLIFTVFSPLLYLAMRRAAGQVVIVLASVIWCGISTTVGLDETLWHYIPSFAIFLFIVGALLAIRGMDLCRFARKWWLPVIMLYAMTVLAVWLFHVPWPKNGLILGVQCLFWFVFADFFGRFMQNRVYQYLCECAFFVFAIHSNSLVPFRLVRGATDLLPESVLSCPGILLGASWSTGVLNLAFCVALYAICKRVVPLLARIMNGKL